METQGSKIADFMIALAEDPARLANFKYAMEDELDQSDLSEEQRDVIRSKDIARIRAAIQDEAGPDAIVVVWEDFREP